MSTSRATPLPLPSPGPGSRPLEYPKQHVSLEQPEINEHAFRQAWRVRSRLDKLFVAGEITGYEWRCASEFRTANEIAFESVLRAPLLDGTGRASGYPANVHPSERHHGALRRLHDLHGRVGRETVRLLEAVIVEDLKWRELGKRLQVQACTSKRRAIAAIKTLGQRVVVRQDQFR